MRTIIAGSRCVDSLETVEKAVESCGWKPTVVVSGTARGVDRLGEEYARNNSIPVERYPARWEVYGKSAGYKRNVLMATKADALVAVWDGESRGTKHMIEEARKAGLEIYVHSL